MQLLESAPIIQEAQLRQSRESDGLNPVLAVILASGECGINPASQAYVNRKKTYGEQVGIRVEVHSAVVPEIPGLIDDLNCDQRVDATILQLPLPDPSLENELCERIDPGKDVDGLHPESPFFPATPLGIMHMLDWYEVALHNGVTVNGAFGKLVGSGLVPLLRQRGDVDKLFEIDFANKDELPHALAESDVVVSAVGRPNLIRSQMLRSGMTIVDAGVSPVFAADTSGQTVRKTVGDIAPNVYHSGLNLRITKHLGGVGPMTVMALFDNVIRAANSNRRAA